MAFRTNKTPVLQEKSASGAVATFNTALAMPLASCNIAVTATQSGSGTPSPQNIRSINGWSAINIGATDLNLIGLNTRASGTDSGIESEIQADNRIIASGRSTGNADISFTLANNILLKGGQPYTFSLNGTDTRSNSLYFFIHVVGDGYANYIIPSNEHSVTFTTSRDVFIDSCLLRTFNGGKVDIDAKAQLEVGSTAHAFESYSGNAYTIQIGSTVYGGEYDARTGLFTVTHEIVDLTTLTWSYSTANDYFYSRDLVGIVLAPHDNYTSINGLCSHMQLVCYTSIKSAADCITVARTGNMFIYAPDYTTVEDFLVAFSGAKLVYPLATPQTIQLPPCPIDTLEGVNNIWADTGDIDLTYKDLDIAKRGNFREVFKLPS